MSNIPSVNLSDFLSKDESLRKDFVSKIGKAYQEIGFVSPVSYTHLTAADE